MQISNLIPKCGAIICRPQVKWSFSLSFVFFCSLHQSAYNMIQSLILSNAAMIASWTSFAISTTPSRILSSKKHMITYANTTTQKFLKMGVMAILYNGLLLQKPVNFYNSVYNLKAKHHCSLRLRKMFTANILTC